MKTKTKRRNVSYRSLSCAYIRNTGRCCKKNYLEIKKDGGVWDMYRNKVLLRQKVTPRRVILPNGRPFVARYKRVSQKNLLWNVTIRRNRTIGPRRQRKRKTQKGAGLLGNVLSLGKNLLTSGALTKDLNNGSRAINSEIGKKLIDEGIKHASELYKYGKSRVTNKALKKALESDVAN